MFHVHPDVPLFRRACVLATLCALAWPGTLWGQGLGAGSRYGQNSSIRGAPRTGQSPAGTSARTMPSLDLETPADPNAPPVAGVRVEGNRRVLLSDVERHVRTRPGRPFNPSTVEGDVRRLNATRMFLDVRTFSQHTPQGVIVVFQVLERPTLEYIKYVGNQKVRRNVLVKETGLKKGDPLDPYAVQEGRRKIEEYYRRQGFNKVTVRVIEGTGRNDHGAAFLINEVPRQDVWRVRFEGNTVVADGRLKTQIQTKPPITWPVYIGSGGRLDPKAVQSDVEQLESYYKALGFFRARVGREITYSSDGRRATVTFIIDEGPRYTVRNTSVIGNTKLSTEELTGELNLASGEFFDQMKMNRDVRQIMDSYGGRGYIHADVNADIRYLGHDEPGKLDVVYKISEGDRFVVSEIVPHITGDNPHTRITTVLNRLSIRPGDVADRREVDASVRRLRASQLFAPMQPGGSTGPRMAFRAVEDTEPSRRSIVRGPAAGSSPAAPRSVGARGQSPDGNRGAIRWRDSRWVDPAPATTVSPRNPYEHLPPRSSAGASHRLTTQGSLP